MTDWLMDGLLSWLAKKVVDLLGSLLSLLTSKLFMSPDVTVWPQVQTIADKSALVVDSCFILAILAVAVAVMTGDSIQVRQGVKELIPRLVVGFALSAFSIPLTSQLITIANALTVSMTGIAAPTTQTINFVKARINAAWDDSINALLITILGLLIVVLLFALLASWLVRVGVLLLLAGIAPIALACYATPWTQGSADLWWRCLLGCLATSTLQAVAFSTGIDLVINPGSNLPIELGTANTDTLNLLLIVIMLWITLKIPSLMGRLVTHRGAPNIGALLLRTVALQGVLRRVPVIGGGR